MSKMACIFVVGLLLVVSGCGSKAGPKLSELSYAELTILLESEMREVDEQREVMELFEGTPDYMEWKTRFEEQVTHAKYIRELRRAAWESEHPK